MSKLYKVSTFAKPFTISHFFNFLAKQFKQFRFQRLSKLLSFARNRISPTYNKGHRKKLAFTNRFYLTFFLNSIGLLVKKEKNHNNVT